MDLASINLQRLIFHKPKQTNKQIFPEVTFTNVMSSVLITGSISWDRIIPA